MSDERHWTIPDALDAVAFILNETPRLSGALKAEQDAHQETLSVLKSLVELIKRAPHNGYYAVTNYAAYKDALEFLQKRGILHS